MYNCLLERTKVLKISILTVKKIYKLTPLPPSSCLILQICVVTEGEKKLIDYSNEIKNESRQHQGIQFVKIAPVPLTPTNLSKPQFK